MLVGWGSGSGWVRSWVLWVALALTAGLVVVPSAGAEEPAGESQEPGVHGAGSVADAGTTAVPGAVGAGVDGAVEPLPVDAELSDSVLPLPEGAVEELVSERRENRKVFRGADGGRFAHVFTGPVHVADEHGELVDIDG